MPRRPSQLPGFLSRQVITSRHFHRDLAPGRRAGVTVVSAGYEQCNADYVMRRRSFPWYGIELVAHGGGRLELGDAAAELAPGLVYSYGPSTAHAITAAADRPPDKWFIDLAGNGVPSALHATGLTPGTIGLADAASPARQLFDLIVDTGRHAGPEVDNLLSALAFALLEALARPRMVTSASPAQGQATYERCRAWLSEHAASGDGVIEAAAALSLSPAYISRLFQRFGRVSPGTYARRIRLQQAADRLRMTRDRIQDIAAAAGYADGFHFSRAFSRTFGLAPRAFRACAGADGLV